MTCRSQKERLNAARKLSAMEDLPGPFLVDSIQDEASIAFGSFPDRLYIVHQGKVAYQGGVGPHGYVVSSIIMTTFEVYLIIF